MEKIPHQLLGMGAEETRAAPHGSTHGKVTPEQIVLEETSTCLVHSLDPQ